MDIGMGTGGRQAIKYYLTDINVHGLTLIVKDYQYIDICNWITPINTTDTIDSDYMSELAAKILQGAESIEMKNK